MSVFEVNRFCRDVMRQPRLRELIGTSPAMALSRYDLSDPERRMLQGGDVAGLHRAGANEFLLGYLARYGIFGLDFASYGERMRSRPAS